MSSLCCLLRLAVVDILSTVCVLVDKIVATMATCMGYRHEVFAKGEVSHQRETCDTDDSGKRQRGQIRYNHRQQQQ